MALRTSKPQYETYFSDPALVKAYYIPTEPIQLSDNQKKLTMSPCRIPEKESGIKQPITPETEAYLRQTDYVYDTEHGMPTHPTPSPPSTAKFDESWPSTDKPSSLSENRSHLTDLSGSKHDTQHTLSPGTDDSVISKYLRRFRNDPPLRREDRKAPSLSEFWWGSKSGNNNHGDQDKCSRRHDYGSYHATDRLKYHRDVGNNRAGISSTKATENTCSERDLTVSSDTTPRSTNSSHKPGKRISFMPETPKTKSLLERTDDLLSKSDMSEAEISPPVSSHGLGRSSRSSNSGSGSSGHRSDNIYHSTPEEGAARPVTHRPAHRDGPGYASRSSYAQNSREKMSSANPEDDILYQWRLKRRMEQAQQKVHKAEQDAKYTSYRRNKAQLSAGHGYRSRFDIGEARVPVPRSYPTTDPPRVRESSQVTCDRVSQPAYNHAEQNPAVLEAPVEPVRIGTPTKVERLVQTDAEQNQATTQTTPTVDPISECTGSVTTVPTHTLRERIASRSPERVRTNHGTREPHTAAQRCDCCHSKTQQTTPNTTRRGADGPDPLSDAQTPTHTPVQQSHDRLTDDDHHHSQPKVIPQQPDSRTAWKKVIVPNEQTTPISKTVHEVASQRLFHQLDTPGSEPDTPDDPTSPEPDRKAQTPVQGGVSDTSEGEFSDDELLAALREKRAQLLTKLQSLLLGVQPVFITGGLLLTIIYLEDAGFLEIV